MLSFRVFSRGVEPREEVKSSIPLIDSLLLDRSNSSKLDNMGRASPVEKHSCFLKENWWISIHSSLGLFWPKAEVPVYTLKRNGGLKYFYFLTVS